MTLVTERRASITLLRYRGSHACSDKDHQLDKDVKSFLLNEIQDGRELFLLDVRNLKIVFPSGLSDLWQRAWSPVTTGNVKLALLWRPDPKNVRDRFGYLVSMMSEPSSNPRKGMQFFTEKAAAIEFLQI
jgi:hypothetical protein